MECHAQAARFSQYLHEIVGKSAMDTVLSEFEVDLF